jgi:hypothetical protein
MMAILSLVMTVVLRRLISRTWPATPPISTRSPIAMGRSASDERQRVQVHPDHLQADVETESQQGVADDTCQGELHGGLQVGPPQQTRYEIAADNPLQENHQPDQKYQRQQAGHRDATAREDRVVEHPPHGSRYIIHHIGHNFASQ